MWSVLGINADLLGSACCVGVETTVHHAAPGVIELTESCDWEARNSIYL